MPITLKKRLRQAYTPQSSGPAGGGALISAAKPKPVAAKKTTAPVAPKKPPPGFYDPDLDAAERASGRGLGDLRIDTETANERASTDYITNRGQLAQRFRDLGQAQTGGVVASGVIDAGAIRAGAARRTQNEGVEADALGSQYQRGVDDRALGLQRAERENVFFGQDTARQRSFQARAAGYVEPVAPKKPGPLHGLSPAQKALVNRRTSASSKKRLADRLRAENKKKGKK